MSNESLEQRARELLAAEYRRKERHLASTEVMLGHKAKCDSDIAIRAIIRALESTPAQEVGEVALPDPVARVDYSSYTRVRWPYPAPYQYPPDGTGLYTADQLRAYGQACASARTAPAEGERLHAHLLDMLGVSSHEEAGAEIGRLHAASVASATGDDWRPIATAPNGWSDTIIGGYAPDEENYSLPSREMFFSEQDKAWRLTSDPRFACHQPTHWKPLPEHPGGDTSRPAKAEGDVYCPTCSAPAVRTEVAGAFEVRDEYRYSPAADSLDADRYRWLRDQFETYGVGEKDFAGFKLWPPFAIPEGVQGDFDAKFNAAIDTARTVSRGDA